MKPIEVLICTEQVKDAGMLTFTKVVVNGWHINDAKLILKNGEEAIAVGAEMQTEEFATTFLLKEAITPDALRLEFSQKRVELYEIAVF